MTYLMALDIDGTLVHKQEALPQDVLTYLRQLSGEGHFIYVVTGRMFSWAYKVLHDFDFGYYLALQNGAIILKMPEKKVVYTRYMDASCLSLLTEFCSKEPTDVVVYAGLEYQDLCYFRPQHFDAKLLTYVQERSRQIGEIWVDLEDFQELPFSSFPSVKYFGTEASLSRLKQKVEANLDLDLPLCQDPYNEAIVIGQITRRGTDKGQAILDLKSMNPDIEFKTIVAGDDNNDIPMFQEADISIVMETAPRHIKTYADIVAPPAKMSGIIVGIQKAIDECKNN